jgi:ABC-type uncharacterized transport system YnjBCD ATPase subunit
VTGHVFVDESKKNGFLIVAAIVLPEDLQVARKTMRSLCLPNQRRIHFKDEKPARKKQILDAIEAIGATARIYIGPRDLRELDARRVCLKRLFADLTEMGSHKLVIELDESLVDHDRRWLFAARRAVNSDLEYSHLRAHEECLLWIADAAAWCWAAKGSWRERIRKIGVVEITDL